MQYLVGYTFSPKTWNVAQQLLYTRQEYEHTQRETARLGIWW